jgi:hypothetical protein
MAQKEEGGAFDHPQRLVAGGRVPRPPRKDAHERLGKDTAHPHRRIEFVVGDQDQDRELFVVLRRELRQGFLQPRTPPCGHDDGHNCRHLGVH